MIGFYKTDIVGMQSNFFGLSLFIQFVPSGQVLFKKRLTSKWVIYNSLIRNQPLVDGKDEHLHNEIHWNVFRCNHKYKIDRVFRYLHLQYNYRHSDRAFDKEYQHNHKFSRTRKMSRHVSLDINRISILSREESRIFHHYNLNFANKLLIYTCFHHQYLDKSHFHNRHQFCICLCSLYLDYISLTRTLHI